MAGGIIQLISCGLHDIYLIGNPQITFFKKVYSKYTHFAMESMFLPVDGRIQFSQYTSVNVERSGDLLKNMVVEMNLGHEFLSVQNATGTLELYSNGVYNHLTDGYYTTQGNQYIFHDNMTGKDYELLNPDFKPVTTASYPDNSTLVIGYQPMIRLDEYHPRIANKLIEYAELTIGSQVVDKLYGKWIDIWAQLSNNYEDWERSRQMSNASILINKDESKTYVELPFWFSKNPGLALPMVALQYHDVRCNIKYADPISWTSNNDLNSISNHENPSYISGKFSRTLTMGSVVLQTGAVGNNVEAGYVAKVTSSGWQWARKINYIDMSSNITVNALKVRDISNGDIVVAGVYTGHITFEGSDLSLNSFEHSQDIFIAKIDQYGNWLSADSAGGSEFDRVYGIDIDLDGNVYVSGYFAGVAHFINTIDGVTQGLTLVSESCTTDIFIAKLGNDRRWKWAHTATGYDINYTDSGNGVFVSDDGKIFVTGNFSNDSSFNQFSIQQGFGSPDNATGDNYRSVFVAEVDASGWKWVNYLQSTVSNASWNINARSITYTKNDLIIVVGSLNGEFAVYDTYDPTSGWTSANSLVDVTTQSPTYDERAFIGVIRRDPVDGLHKWTYVGLLNETDYQIAHDVEYDLNEGVFVVGETKPIITTQNTAARSFVIHIPDIVNITSGRSTTVFQVNCNENRALSVTQERDGYIVIAGEYRERLYISPTRDLSGTASSSNMNSYVVKYNVYKNVSPNMFDTVNCEWIYGSSSSNGGSSSANSVVQSIAAENVTRMSYTSEHDFIVGGTINYNHNLVIKDGRVYGDYIYLDTDERRLYANLEHEYLIEQVQYSNPFVLDRNYTMTELHFNHPIKELIWNYQLQSRIGSFDYWNPQGNDLMEKFRIEFNGVNRINDMDSGYYRLVQAYNHHSGGHQQSKERQEGGYYTYSFAARPEQYQPTGTSNFSRIDSVILHHTVSQPCNMEIYAVNYNVLRIVSGMAGVAYSN
jgi:hypothetical protein